MQGNYPSFNFREHFCLLYKCKSCNFFAVPATVFIGLLLALPVTMIIIGKLTFLSSILFSLFVYMNITAKSAEDDIHTQLIQYTVFLLVQYLFLWNFYSSISKNNIKHQHKGRLSKEIHNHKEFLLFPHDMTDNDFVVERYMQDF